MNHQPKQDEAPRPYLTWTPDLDAILIAERAQNKSCAAIGALVGRSKNSVLSRYTSLRIAGKIEGDPIMPRNAWKDRRAAKRQYAADQARAMRILRAMDVPPPIVGPAAPVYAERFQEGYQGQQGRVSIVDLTSDTCHFPIDQPEGLARYCGDSVRPGSPYCEHHAQRCLAVPVPRRLGRWRYT